MSFSEQDRKDYQQFLKRQLREEKKKPQTIAKMFNLNNLYEDLKNLTNEHSTSARQAA